MGRLLLGLLVLAFCVILIAGAVSEYLSNQPDYVYVESSQAFIFPTPEGVVLVLASGEYWIDGQNLNSGCYHMLPPQAGQERGKAVYAWFTCR